MLFQNHIVRKRKISLHFLNASFSLAQSQVCTAGEGDLPRWEKQVAQQFRGREEARVRRTCKSWQGGCGGKTLASNL